MGNMLRLNRSQVCESLQGIFRFKHVSFNAIFYHVSMTKCNNMRLSPLDGSGYSNKTRGSISLVSLHWNFVNCATDISLIRERRAPFSPAIVKRLIKNGVKVIVQPSNRRAYPMQVTKKIYFALFVIIKSSFHSTVNYMR